MWDSKTATVIITFNGHKSGVTTLAFDKDGVRLASGAKDTDIIVWDLVAEVGLFKFRGHKGQITGLHFLAVPSNSLNANGYTYEDAKVADSGNGSLETITEVLLSTAKDGLIKVWDVELQHCIETHITQSGGECWSMGVSVDKSGLVTAGNDGEMKIWSIDLAGLSLARASSSEHTPRSCLRERGTMYRQGKENTIGVSFHPGGRYIAAHGNARSVEIWRIRSEHEVQKVLARKRKRKREKVLPSDTRKSNGIMDGEEKDAENIASADVNDVIVPYVIVRTGGKVRSANWTKPGSSKALQLLIAETNNQLEVWNIPVKLKEKSPKSLEPSEYSRLVSVETPGHRADVRALALSSDDRMLASASNGELKIWNIKTQNCIRTLECGYALCAAFLPGDKIVIVGNRTGELELFDISSSTLIESSKAHEGPIWTLHVHPDGRSMATGSADKTAKFFNFEVIQENVPGTKRTSPRFKLVHLRTLKVTDDVLSLRFSPDSRLIALALLDNTVKVFFIDSLKLFLNLYGHKLPVLNMDISYDSKLIVTCSADKNVRLWGLDFGDCHKAFFAHQDSIMQVAFVPHNQDGNGHHFLSASKDRAIKYWDGDKFEQVQKLEGHHGEIWALAVSRTGDFVVSASHDKSIRVWKQTDEQIFLEEEREKELEELYESTLTTSLEPNEDTGEEKPEVASVGKQTIETLMAGEKIAEALEIGVEDLKIMTDYHKAKVTQPNVALPARNPIYLAYNNISAEGYLLSVTQKVKPAALQDALLVLPFDKVTAFFSFLRIWAERQWNMPLTCRILFFMLKTHHKQIVASKQMRVLLDGIRVDLRRSLRKQKDEMGFNLAALRYVARKAGETSRSDFIGEELLEDDENLSKGKRKRGFVDIA